MLAFFDDETKVLQACKKKHAFMVRRNCKKAGFVYTSPSANRSKKALGDTTDSELEDIPLLSRRKGQEDFNAKSFTLCWAIPRPVSGTPGKAWAPAEPSNNGELNKIDCNIEEFNPNWETVEA